MRDWFVQFLAQLSQHIHSDMVSVAITKKCLRDNIPDEYNYDDVVKMMHSLGYTEHDNFFCLELPGSRKRFCASVVKPKWTDGLLAVTYERDPNHETKLISWPKTKYCHTEGYNAVSILKVYRYLSGNVETKRVFVPESDINDYL